MNLQFPPVAKVLPLLLALVLLNACAMAVPETADAPDAAASQTEESPEEAAEGELATSYPVTIENCGRTLTLDKPPQRALAYYNYLAETLLAFGLKDQIAALMVEYSGFEPAREYSADYANLNVLVTDGDPPSREVTLSLNPDFAYVAFPEYSLDGSRGFATLEDFASIGAQVYISAGQCPGFGYENYTVEVVLDDLLNLGRIFGVEERAQQIVGETRDRIAAVQEKVAELPPVKVIYYGELTGQTPLGLWRQGLQSDIIRLAGGENVFASGEKDYEFISAEEVAAQDIEAFLVPNEEVGKFLVETFPNLEASQSNRVIVVPHYRDGIHLADGVEELAKAIHPEAFAQSDSTSPSVTYPVTIENCGCTLTFDKAPERVVSLYPPNTEMLILLGVQDRIVGVGGYQAAAYLLPETEAAYEGLAEVKLTDDGASSVPREVLIAAQPDLVTDNQPNWFYNAEKGFATVEEITAAGAQIYTLSAKCGGGKVDATIEDIYTDLENYGKIFDVEERAEAVIAEMKATIADVQARIEGQPPVKVLIYDAGEGPLSVFGPGTYDYVFELAGGVNVFADLDQSYGQVSIEEVATREIDVFVVPDYGPDYTYAPSAEERAEWLIQAFPETEASKNRRVVILPYQNINPSAQNAEGVLVLAKGFYPEAFE